MTGVRPAAVAGRFYPQGPHVLRNSVEAMMAAVEVPDDDQLARGYVVPHAGHRFSGPVAAHVYARLRRHAARLRRIVLIGPSHFVPLAGFAQSPAAAWRTPLGTVPVTAVDGVATDAAPHEREHSLEVQLPFLQVCLADFDVSPIAVGKCTIAEAAAVIDRLVDEDTLLLCSTDLSHYHDEATAKQRDRATAEAIQAGEPRRIHVGDACGVFALRGTVGWAAHRGLPIRQLRLATSADTYGGRERVVGYPAFAIG
jgi:AmmeMemoRadiSam system protein B